MNLQEWKELGFICFCMLYMAAGLMGFMDTIITCKKRQAQTRKELRRLRWEVARVRCGY